ncbi:MAG: ABC transporter substrate-binding protein [Promethearchaeota archaeon]
MKLGKNLLIAIILGSLLMITKPIFKVNDNFCDNNYVPNTMEEKISTSNIPPIRTTEPPREETVWMTGSYNSPTQFLPWSAQLPPGADAGMYEALFGYNSVTKTLVPCIGISYSWSVTGNSITIDLNPLAKWSDGSPIQADDVVYSYELASNQTRYRKDFTARFIDLVEVDTDTVRFDINTTAGYNFSRQVEIWIMYNIPIVPKHVWSLIVADKGTNDFIGIGYQYDWFDSIDVPNEWKVISGPYAPVYRNASKTTCAYQYREDWWGAGILYQDLPNAAEDPPKYIGTIRLTSNIEQNLALLQGDVDLHASYYYHIWEIWEDATPSDPGYYISCWYDHDPPYQLAIGPLITLAPNHLLADSPLGVKNFREALAYAINYTSIPAAAASGYWSKSKPGYIDNNSALHAPYYNGSITAKYQKFLNVTNAIVLLQSIPGMTGSVASGWTYNGHAVGPYEAIVPIGWSDVIAYTEMVCNDITDNLGITITATQVDFETIFQSSIENNNFDFAIFRVGNRISDPPQRFLDYMRGTHLWNKNATNWNNPTFEALWQTLETANETTYAKNLNLMQEILAEEVPEIPGFVDGYWYAFSEYFWEGWASEANKFQQLVTTWTDNQFVIKTRLMLNLKSIDRKSPMITINSPSENQVYGEFAPNFNVEVYDANLDTMWYTIDGGFTNITFITNGTIDQNNWSAQVDGPMEIIFYANDTLGHINSNQVIINKDTTVPEIIINSPSPDQVFRGNPPEFSLSINESNLESIWYTLDNGLVNITCEISGQIDQNYWNALKPGSYTLRFYANDTMGYKGFSEVSIKKKARVISVYNPIIISIITVLVTITIRYKIKKKLK